MVKLYVVFHMQRIAACCYMRSYVVVVIVEDENSGSVFPLLFQYEYNI